jgi:hypothetical protein
MTVMKTVRTATMTVAMLALMACAPSAITPPQVLADRQGSGAELAAMGWNDIVAGNPDYVVFGELHDTQEAPQLFGRIAGALARSGKHVLVAVELSAAHNADYKAAWNGPHDRFAASLPESDWNSLSDGRTSEAMLAMLTQLHEQKVAGAPISLVAFNGFRDEEQRARLATPGSQAGHEAGQAENIATERDAGQYDYVLVLVGNLHARIVEVADRGATFQPMAMRLKSRGRVLSLNMASAGGTMWNCLLRDGITLQPGQNVTDAMMDCGAHPTLGLTGYPNIPHLALGQMPGAEHGEAYDGHFWLGAISGSPPARQGQPRSGPGAGS